MSDLNDILYSPIPEVQDLAQRAVRIKTLFEEGQISTDEYQELATDLIELKGINEAMVSLELARELWAAVEVLKNLKFFASIM